MDTLVAKKKRLLDIFNGANTQDKHHFLDTSFNVFFEVVPDVSTGSIFELQDSFYVPVAYHGYDPMVIGKLKFEIGTAFLLHKGLQDPVVKVHTTTVPSRVYDTSLPEETKDVLRQLGTLGQFFCMYVPLKVRMKTIGMICVEKYDNDLFTEDSIHVMKYYARLVSAYYYRYDRDMACE